MARPYPPIYPGDEEVRKLYLDKKLSLAGIAAEFGVTKTTASRWLRRAGVESRGISEATILSGAYGVHSESHRETLRRNIAIARTKITAESREKHRQKMLGRTPPNKGKQWTDAHREVQMRIRATERYRENLSASLRGEKNYNWKGGHESRSPRGWRWKEIRKQVYERDNWTCADCGCKCLNAADAKKHPKRKIQAHHIIPRRLGGTDELLNLVTLCVSCHHKRERRYADALIA